ncbi:1,4-beta-xylanase [Ureibacillus massiliensis 4400831 = CIP 108448 = CCUG 49529]|uniref:1,4-beta-xylanase n=1 Tax=Ureibacillus massiliensis 4400831 = CIP 108448 = CCUG 49529 TaxID=1211035 RepID=A0A0A3J3N5_9BACL|nr:choice-of-anchor I family protein [Ureibacillus massiliensis]KGR90280.1 1,4-beta-xylanase [Ureibacillus massiliensis 4400831 = CIP 108448 = CCUG 49529]
MSKFTSKTMFALATAGAVVVAPTISTQAAEVEYEMSVDARYNSGIVNADGGTTEIIAYNKHNNSVYLVNGESKKVEAVSLDYNETNAMNLKPFFSVDVAELIATVDADFVYGGLPSIAVHPNENVIVAAVQANDYTKEGYAVFLTGEGELISIVKTGVQPDNITFSPDGSKVLTANEGEPRDGYGEGIIDPQGTISVIDVTDGFTNLTAENVTFEAFDTAEKRAELIENQVILKKGSNPSVDLEPEYIVVSEDSKQAYVALQENNAIAKIDLTTNEAVSVEGLGFKDFSAEGNELDLRKDKVAKLQNENYFGIYMPDGIATYSANGKNYIVTANEGDGREWGEEDTEAFHLNENEVEVDGNEIVLFDTAEYEGFEEGKEYIFGGRSFSIIDADTLEVVYDSGSDFERITAELYPEFFNSSNDEVKLDDRSGKKGPEPEDVKIGKIGDQVFAFIGLERIGGIAMYNITDPTSVEFVDYINTRDFSEDIKGDVSPEGLAFVGGEKPMLLVGHEVSGTVTVFDLLKSEAPVEENPAEETPTKEVSFNDIKGHYAEDAILAVANAGLFSGINENTFAPNKGFTQSQASIVLNRLAEANGLNFDIPENHSNKPITREDFAVAVYNYLEQSGAVSNPNASVTNYKDDAKLSTDAKQAIYALQAEGLMTGDEKQNFNPNKPLTRAHAAIVFSHILGE